jgi:RimJ/RimL family protein N-acetyltransferase
MARCWPSLKALKDATTMYLDCRSCVVRGWSATDRDSLVRFANNRKVWLNLAHRFPHPYTPADADAWFALLADMPVPTHWAVEVEGCAAGGVGVDLGEGIYEKSGRLGYWLGEPHWGRGITTDAVRATSEYVMAKFGVTRLEASVLNGILHRCGASIRRNDPTGVPAIAKGSRFAVNAR